MVYLKKKNKKQKQNWQTTTVSPLELPVFPFLYWFPLMPKDIFSSKESKHGDCNKSITLTSNPWKISVIFYILLQSNIKIFEKFGHKSKQIFLTGAQATAMLLKVHETWDPKTLFLLFCKINVHEDIPWGNSRHFVTPLLVSPRNGVWVTSAEIPYW